MTQNKFKKIIKGVFSFLLILMMLSLCGVGIYAYSLINNPDIITIGVGEKYTLTPKENSFFVRSYNADIVTVDRGSTITGNALGEAVVGMRYTYFDRDFYRFRVVEAPTSITLNQEEIKLSLSESKTLSAMCSSGTHDFFATFTSNDENVATVDKNGVITPKGVGECEITASVYNGIKDSCKVTVFKDPTSLSFEKSKLTLGESEEISLTAKFKKGEYSSEIEYLSSDESIATYKNGIVTAKAQGKCTLSVKTHNGITTECDLTIKKLADKLSLVVLDKYDIDTDIRVITSIPKNTVAGDVDISVSDKSILSVDEKNKNIIHPLKKGTATITATLKNGVTASKKVTIGDYNKNKFRFNILNQYPTLPTGCEVVSLTSVLNHYGMKVSMTDMADDYMPTYTGAYYNVSPSDYYLGNPYTQDGFGCFPKCIVKTAHNYFDDKNIDDYIAVDISGCSPDELYNYLNNNIPVITWVTSGFANPEVDGSWTVDGETIVWSNFEHCLVTTGYDKQNGTVTVCDDAGGYTYTVSRAQFEKVFKGVGSMAVVILKK